MNKAVIDSYIPKAYEAIKKCKIANDKNEVQKTFRGQISTFGAAITMGSIDSAIACFSDKGGASVDRTQILNAIAIILGYTADEKDYLSSFKKYRENIDKQKEDIINAAIALKLAMNLYQLI